jgi:hypothetical protein
MSPKHPPPPKRNTAPDVRGRSGPTPKVKRSRSEAPTEPPPTRKGSKAVDTKTSGTRSRRPSPGRDGAGATVDEVTADLSKDPRRERDDD